MSDHVSSHVLALPPSSLALVIQHVACGPGGLANGAALSQTCKLLHSLSEGPAVTYSNLFLAAAISSPDHPAWQWLAKRSGRLAGLSLELRLGDDDDAENAAQLSDWVQPLQTLYGIPGIQLRLEWVGRVDDVNHPCIARWLKQHGQLISHLIVKVDIIDGRLTLRDFSEAAAPCRSIDLGIRHSHHPVFDLSSLAAVAGSLCCLTCQPYSYEVDSLIGASAFKSMSQLTALHLDWEDLCNEDPWVLLASLTSLQRLDLVVSANGDPSPLSALTKLTFLKVHSIRYGQVPFSFSRLQPLSTLQQLEVLHMGAGACAATSLQGLAGLSTLKVLELCCLGSEAWKESVVG
jgi:hypothetical protein